MDRRLTSRAGVPTFDRAAAARVLRVSVFALACLSGDGAAQSHPPANVTRDAFEDEALRPASRPASPLVALARRDVLRGSVSAVAAEAKKSDGELRVPLAASGVSELTSKFKVVTGRGRVELLASKPFVALPERGTSVLSSSDAPKIAADSSLRVGEKTPLPWMVVDTKPAEASEPAQVRTARPYLGLARAILWDGAMRYHVALAQLGIDAEVGGTGKLEEPVVASLSVSCDDVAPARVTLDQIGPAGEKAVLVSCSRSAAKAPAQQNLKVRLADAELPYNF